jgi:hypothetical protein
VEKGWFKIVGDEFRQDKRNYLQLLAFPLAGIILYFVLKDQDWVLILESLDKTNLPLFITGAAVYTIGFFLCDIAFDHYLWNRIIVRISWLEVAALRGVAIMLMTVFPQLGVLTVITYMSRKKGIKLLPMLSTSAVLAYADLFSMLPQLAFCLLMVPQHADWITVLFCFFLIAFVVLSWVFPLRRGARLFPWVYNLPVLYGLRILPNRMVPRLALIRAAWPVFQVAGHYLALRAVGIHPPLPVVIVAVMFMTMTSFMPISAAGFGGPNFVAMLFVPYALNPEMVSAYSLLFQFCFLAGRLMIGIVFIKYLWDHAIKSGDQVELAPDAADSISRGK